MEEQIRLDIARLRKTKGWTIKEFSEKLGFKSQGSYQKIENGSTAITVDRAKQIADLLEIDFYELLGSKKVESENEDNLIQLERAHRLSLIENKELTKKLNQVNAVLKNTYDYIHIYGKVLRSKNVISSEMNIKNIDEEWGKFLYDYLTEKRENDYQTLGHGNYIHGNSIYSPLVNIEEDLIKEIREIETLLEKSNE